MFCGTGTDITKVDEYWELDLNTPNTAKSAPQLTFLISPTGTTDSLYAVFVVNQRMERPADCSYSFGTETLDWPQVRSRMFRRWLLTGKRCSGSPK